MNIDLPKTLEKDLYEFCMMNNIEDVNSFIVTCFRNGYYIAKYGISPEDNFKSQNKPFEIKEFYEDIGSSEKRKQVEETSGTTESNQEELKQVEEVKKTVKRSGKRSIKVIKN